MARNLQVDEQVYVPVAKLSTSISTGSSFIQRRVLAVERRSVRINVGNGVSELIASSLCHRNIGIAILNIGDLETEQTLLDPLAKSVLQFCRLLVPDDQVVGHKVRSLDEVQKIWEKQHAAFTHLILIGHGSKARIKFACGGWSATKEFMDVLDCPDVKRKTILSLCCHTGYRAFGGRASSYACCERFIGPFHSVHGATASQFAQTLLAYHLLEGETANVAFKHARASVAGSASFRLWANEQLIAGPK